MSTLVDTNVVSELARPRPDPRVTAWAAKLDAMIVSVVTIEEVWFGLTLRRNRRIERWFDDFIDRDCTVLEITTAIAKQAGVLRGQLAMRGRVRTQADMLIAATSAVHGLTLATRNERDFEDCGVTVVNPFVDGDRGVCGHRRALERDQIAALRT